MGKAIGIIAIKGGVGKTTIATSLAAVLAREFRKKVLLVDANYSAPNAGLHLDIVEPEHTIHHVLAGKIRAKQAVHQRYGVDVIPGSYVYDRPLNVLKLRDKIAPLMREYDLVVFDSSPALNDELLSTMLASDLLFVVTTADYPTLSCSLRAAKLARQRGKPIAGLILNKVRDPGYELSIRELEIACGIPVVARIHDEKMHTRALFTRVPAALYKRRSQFARELRSLASVIIGERAQTSVFERFFSFNLRKESVNRELLKERLYTSAFMK